MGRGESHEKQFIRMARNLVGIGLDTLYSFMSGGGGNS